MLNVLIALLLVINAAFWLWTQDVLSVLGWGSPHAEQGAALAEIPIAPDRIVPETPEEAKAPLPTETPNTIDTANAPVQWACWQLGPFAISNQALLQQALPLTSEDLRWSVVPSALPQRWVIASERSATPQALKDLVKLAKDQGLDHRTADTDVLRGRLILGTFVNRDLAVKALTQLLEQGWGPLSVMRERPPLPALLLQAHVASTQALARTQAALAGVPTLGSTGLQTQACEPVAATPNAADTPPPTSAPATDLAAPPMPATSADTVPQSPGT